MPWAKLDDRFDDNPDLDHLPHAAVALYVCMITFSSRHLSDGFVPEVRARRLYGYSTEAIEALCSQCAPGNQPWVVAVDDGYQIRSFLNYNPARAEIERKREAAADRMRRLRGEVSSTDVHHPVRANKQANNGANERENDAENVRENERCNENATELQTASHCGDASNGSDGPIGADQIQSTPVRANRQANNGANERENERAYPVSPIPEYSLTSKNLELQAGGGSAENAADVVSAASPWWVSETGIVRLIADAIHQARLKGGKVAYADPALIDEARVRRLAERIAGLDPGGDDVADLFGEWIDYHHRAARSRYTDPLRAISGWVSRSEDKWRRLKRERERDRQVTGSAAEDRRRRILGEVGDAH